MIYYQYELGEVEGKMVVIALHSSKNPFAERQITQEQALAIKLGYTTESEL